MRLALFTGCLAILLSSCATIPDSAPPFEPAPPRIDGRINFYIYRIGAFPTKRTPTVFVDDREVFDPPEGAYTVVAVAPGMHRVRTVWSGDTGAPNLSFEIAVPSGKPYYLKLTGKLFSSYPRWHNQSEAMSPDQGTAERELTACCRYIQNRYDGMNADDAFRQDRAVESER
jgi:hypothetical protein